MNFKKPHHTADQNAIEEKDADNYTIKPTGLNIVWGNDPRYWKVTETKAELIQVSWLEVSGVVKSLRKGKKYKVEFELNVKPGAFGWDETQVLVMAKAGKSGSYSFKVAKLSASGSEVRHVTIPSSEPLEVSFPAGIPDSDANQQPNLYFGLYEVWSGKWKGGIEIIKANVTCID
ncbi:protein PHLOEM PROTEIN 2-LIKE A9 [Arachis stenosperma]|uniref:protein PHLOEM PROTEIN 2-LIKE A9 n=1 Tax=Arachis stenosperma TaxID=217475 RepID=UPI0025AC39CE|nr:protein PHLOEM PROTEIN 2-LIKE A9 [Arachis stenosperma]